MASQKQWYDDLPAPRAKPGEISCEEMKDIMAKEQLGRDYIVVDVRRTDIGEGENLGLHPAAINLPAQTFHHTLPVTSQILKNIPKVIFHCQSSRGRGTRCAGWYQDLLDDQQCTASRSYILVGGIKAWAERYPEDLIKV